MGQLHFETHIDFAKLDRDISTLNTKLNDLVGDMKMAGNETNSIFKNIGAGVATYFSAQAVIGFTKELTRVRGEFQQLEVAFETMLGSKAKADKLMAQVVTLAGTTPFSLQEVAAGAKQLLAVQVPAEEVEDTLRRIGDVSAGLSVPISQLIKAYGDVKAKTKLTGEEMRQFMGAGIPMVAELAKHFDVAEDKISDMVSAGKVGFADVQAVLNNLTNEGGIFANLMEKQSKTLTGLISNLGDAWDRMLNSIGSDNEGLLKGSIETASSLVENYERVVDVIKVAAATYGAYRAAVMLNAVALNGYSNALSIATIRQYALNLAQRATPWGIALTAITALVGGLWAYNRFQKAANEAADAASKPLRDEMIQVNALVSALSSANTSEAERKRILKELREIQPDIVDGLEGEHSSTEKLVERLKEYNEQQLQRIWIVRKNSELNAIAEKQRDNQQARLDQEAEAYKRLSVVINEYLDPKQKVQQYKRNYLTGRYQWVVLGDDEKRQIYEQLQEINQTSEEISEKIKKANKVIYDAGSVRGISSLKIFDLSTSLRSLDTEGKKLQEQYDDLLQDRDRFIKTFGDPNKGNEDDLSGGGVEELILRNVAYWEEQKKQAQATLDLLTGEEIDFYAQREKHLKAVEEAEERIAFIRGKGKEEKVKSLSDTIDEEIAQWERYYQFLEYGYTDIAIKQYEALKQNAGSLKEYLIKQETELQERLNSLSPNSESYPEVSKALASVRSKRVEIERGKTVLEQFKESIEQQRDVYAAFEDWRSKFGADKANERYGVEIGEFKTYIDYLKSELAKLDGKTDPSSLAKRAYLGGEISKTESDMSKQTQQALEEVLRETMSHKEKMAMLEYEYQEKIKHIQDEGNEERRAILRTIYDKKRQDLEAAHVQEVDSYRWVFDRLENLNRKALKDYIQRLKEELKLAKYQSAEMLQVRIQMQEKLAQAEKKLSDQLPNALGEVGGLLREAATLAGELDENLAKAINTAAELAEATVMILSGNPFQVAAGILKSVTSLLKLYSAKEKIRQETDKLVDSINQMNDALDRQNKILSGLSGQDKIDAYTKMLADLGGQADKTRSDLFKLVAEMSRGGTAGTWLGNFAQWTHGQLASSKEKDAFQKALKMTGLEVGNIQNWSDDDWIRLIGNASGETKKKLEALYDQWVDLKAKGEETFQLWAEFSTGISFDGVVDNMLDALKAGERTVADFADNVEDMLRTAIIQGFKTRFLIKALEPWYEAFAEYSKEGFTKDEIEALRDNLQEIFGNASQAFKDLSELGVDLTGISDSANSLRGSIKGITEDTASILAGRLNSMHLSVNEHLRVAQRAILYQAQIAANTDRLYAIERYLGDIKSALKPTSDNTINSKRAGGR